MQNVEKAVFPSLPGKLWLKLKTSNAAAGFTGSGLHPVDRERVKKRIIQTTLDEIQKQNAPDNSKKAVTKGNNMCSDPFSF